MNQKKPPGLDLRDRSKLDQPVPPSVSTPVTIGERMAMVDVAVRWSSNILIEVVGNHGRVMSNDQRSALKRAVAALAEYRS